VEIEIVILQDGSIAFFTRSGTFVQGKEAIERLTAALAENGIEFDSISDVEQHAHGPGGEPVWNYEVHKH